MWFVSLPKGDIVGSRVVVIRNGVVGAIAVSFSTAGSSDEEKWIEYNVTIKMKFKTPITIPAMPYLYIFRSFFTVFSSSSFPRLWLWYIVGGSSPRVLGSEPVFLGSEPAGNSTGRSFRDTLLSLYLSREWLLRAGEGKPVSSNSRFLMHTKKANTLNTNNVIKIYGNEAISLWFSVLN